MMLNTFQSEAELADMRAGVADNLTARTMARVEAEHWRRAMSIAEREITDLVDAITDMIDEGIRKSLYGNYDEWREAVEKILKDRRDEQSESI